MQQMTVRRPLIDMIDRGMDPRIAHSNLSKNGLLIDVLPESELLSAIDMKENLLSNDKKEVLTEEKIPVSTAKKQEKVVTQKPNTAPKLV